MKVPWWVWAVGLGGVAYLLYKASSAAGQAVGAAAGAATNAVSSAIANAWLSLPSAVTGIGSGITVLGNAQLPDGSLVTMQSLVGQLKQDANNNVYAAINGNIYQLAPSNAAGNYPATLIGPVPTGS